MKVKGKINAQLILFGIGFVFLNVIGCGSKDEQTVAELRKQTLLLEAQEARLKEQDARQKREVMIKEYSRKAAQKVDKLYHLGGPLNVKYVSKFDMLYDEIFKLMIIETNSVEDSSEANDVLIKTMNDWVARKEKIR